MNQAAYQHILWAGVIGDALGVPVEMRRRDTFQVTGMQPAGTWRQPAGSWSDDTSLTLCLVASLTQQTGVDGLMTNAVAYLTTGQWTPNGVVFGVGRTCRTAIERYQQQVPALQCGPTAETANGNGALMRVAPLALALLPEPDLNRRLAIYQAYTVLTHGHLRAVFGSSLYLEILRHLLQGQSLPTAMTQTWQALQQQSQFAPEVATYRPLFEADLAQAPREKVPSSAYVVATLAAALWANLQPGDFETTVLRAVNLGSDTDTVASVAATIKACRQPEQPLPTAWQAALQNQALLQTTFAGLIQKLEAGEWHVRI